MEITTLGALGARVEALPMGALKPKQVQQLRVAMANHGALVIAGDGTGDAEFVAFMASFGPAVFTTGETPVDGHPDLNVVSNVGRTTPPRSVFHIDTSYVETPPAYTALRAVTVPEEGGETVFTDQFAAYETLDAETKASLADAIVTHETSPDAIGDDGEGRAEHPLFLHHPVVDRTALYLTTPARCATVSGLGQDEARTTIERLYEHSIQPPYAFRHAWAQGDVVIWDNRRTLHRADHSASKGDRILHRAMNIDAAAV